MSKDLQHHIQAGAFLLESPSSPSPSSSLLNPDDNASVEEIKQVTAEEALSVVGCVQRIIDGQDGEEDVPLIGTRDIAQLRTLLSIVFKWGVEPLLSNIIVALPTPSSSKKVQIAVEHTLKDYEHLCQLINEIFALLFPSGLQSRLPQTLITTTVLNRHVTDILKPAIVLGWLPKSLATEYILPLDGIRPLVIRLLSILHPSQSITALGGVISSLSLGPAFAQRTCSVLLSKQVMRTQGVNGLCAAVFGDSEEAGEEVRLDKLEHVAKVLTAVPKGMEPKDYYSATVPRILALLYHEAPASYKRAAAFTISRMLATDGSSSHHEIARGIIMPLLHGSLLHVSTLSDEPTGLIQPINPPSQPGPSVSSSELSPNTALTALSTLITNTDPVPTLIATLLSPVIPSLYSLLEHLEHVRTSDPTTRETVRGMLETWGRVVEKEEGTRIIWSIVQNEGGEIGWKVDLEGLIYQVGKEKNLGLAMFTPEDLEKAEQAGELDPDANIMDLYPDPRRFVSFLKKLDRRDVSGELFVRLLEAYRDSRANDGPMRTLLYLQLIMQIQMKMSDGDGKENILKDPGHILVFVKHALEARVQSNFAVLEETKDPLKFIHTQEDLGKEDSDDEDTPEYDEMTETSINLLLSIFESNPTLSARTEPVLNEIFELLEPLAKDGPEGIKPIAREARMVMTARLASTSTAVPSKGKTKDDAEEARETYQRALKLLQDPILPVRAHGLLLLRELAKGGKMEEALIPAVLAIFLQALQDEDSVWLGWSRAGDGSREVLRGIVGDYAKGTSGGYVWSRGEVDTRVRIGEALGMVIRRCGSALGAYVDIIVPTLLHVVRMREIPTTLRTSAISLLGECAATHALALASYFQDLVGGMVDLLQLESVQTEEEDREKSMDENPTKADSKFPPMRRAAVRFLGVLVREATKAVYNDEDVGYERRLWQAGVLRRAKVTLGYLAATDGDGVVRVMAREVGEQLQQLEEAFVELRNRETYEFTEG
ncbi:armadillo-type protein [Desarmillaria tabescens]|uniref:Armadillo-type protein n=1 Tax=Armillaria tabescens TaxID=1929756 RepID=A0AA39NAA4_ARMTA|nr:armadillo-type protein [Desarmillaria tabescens]KAK0461884.1 armadillo-type protein [Desarmillaria tabescens]